MLKQFDTCETIAMARVNGRGKKLWLEIVIAIILSAIVPILSSFAATVPALFMIALKNPGADVANIDLNVLDFTILGLYATVLTTIFFMLYARIAEKRNMRSMGFTKIKAIPQYLFGLAVGLLMFSAIVGIGTLVGAFTFNGVEENIDIGLIALIFGGFFFQGMSEEVLCRGWMMTSIARKSSVIVGIITNAVVFAFLHILNNGIDILPLINLTLFGVFASIYMLKTDNIWGVSAIHSIWNFVQGSLFGLSVSGMDNMPTILKFAPTDNVILNGGTFGPEGGLIVSIVLVVSIVVTLLVGNKKEI